jgi:glycosyltransferase involved in cell wall biosynthesis
MRKLRIGFLTPEFITEHPTSGGLGNYLNRISKALRDQGHQPEIFVLSKETPGTFDFEGVLVHRTRRAEDGLVRRVRHAEHGLVHRVGQPEHGLVHRVGQPEHGLVHRVGQPEHGLVHRVGHAANHLAFRLARRLTYRTRLHDWSRLGHLLSGALALARCLRRREREVAFDFVQSADYLASGLLVRRRKRPHLVRCSYASDLCAQVEGDDSTFRRWAGRLEIASVRRADIAYAPSQFLADHYHRTYGLNVSVVRPPSFIESQVASVPSVQVPDRYFVHFGQLRARKGTAWLAEALPLAWTQERELRVVCVGPANPQDIEEWESAWGDRRSQVVWLGQLSKPELYAVLMRAEAAVLPSLVDNLPNTVIESLLMGVPVIGSAGASIDELVETGVTGELVPIGDSHALAETMVRFWRKQTLVCRGFRWESPTAQQMRPECAVENLIAIADSHGRVIHRIAE